MLLLPKILTFFVVFHYLKSFVELAHANGLLVGEMLGFKDYIPPFANTTGSDILRGVNYASGSAGIRDETGKKLVLI